MTERKRAERLKPKPLPKRPKLTKEELAERPAPVRQTLTRSKAIKRGLKRKKQRTPKDQLDRLKAGREKKLKDKADNKRVEVSLKTFHMFGDEQFGPGVCWVPQRLLLAVLEQDRHAWEVENQLFVTHTGMIVRGREAAVGVPVAPQNFESLWAGINAPIFDQISGRGVIDAGQGARF
jgi:hypothetical protein